MMEFGPCDTDRRGATSPSAIMTKSNDTETPAPFWKAKRLDEMTPQEWESLCDGCGQCCLHKIEDEDSGDIALTNVACRYLELGRCRCGDYENRHRNVPDCIALTPAVVPELRWLPGTCAYRLVANGQDLYWWHPLVSGDPETVHQAKISVRDRAVSESAVEDLEDHIQAWLDAGVDPFGKSPKPRRRR